MAAANPRRGAVEITIDGRAFVFLPTLGRIAQAEAKLGCSLSDLQDRLRHGRTGDFLALAVALAADESLAEHALGTDMPAIIDAVFRCLAYGSDAGNGGAGAPPA